MGMKRKCKIVTCARDANVNFCQIHAKQYAGSLEHARYVELLSEFPYPANGDERQDACLTDFINRISAEERNAIRSQT